MKNEFREFHKIFFCGIGGIGMSALAISASKENFIISGSDKNINTQLINTLKKENITIYDELEVNENIIKEHDYIVITNTITKQNPLYLYAIKHHKKILLRSEFLNFFLRDKKVVGITGSHGKTTTTSITGFLIKENNLNPSIYVGGIMKQYKSNFIYGKSELVVLEADDAYKSFLSINPFISIITSISLEHFETYQNLEEIKEAFYQYAKKTSLEGWIIANSDNLIITEVISKLNRKNIITYGKNSNCDFQIKNLYSTKKYSYFDIYSHNIKIDTFKITLSGEHNIANATAALIASHKLGISFSNLKRKIKYFKGTERRFEYRGIWNDIQVFDDYAHHPNEIRALFNMIRLKKKICIFFQPHKYIRLEKLWDEFIAVFHDNRDSIVSLYIAEVYGIGEKYNEQFNSKSLVNILKKSIKNTFFINFSSSSNITLNTYKKNIIVGNKSNKKKTIILTLGAGNMNNLFP